jgi:hypothetical protein
MPPFYWRGGDVLREKEYMTVEYKAALADYQSAESEMQCVRADLEKANRLLHERDGYTVALAGFMDGDVGGFTEENRLKAELFELEQEISKCERDLKAKVHVHNAGVAAGLRKEKAYFLIEIERETKALENAKADIDNCKRALAALIVSPRYRTGLDTEYLHARLRQKNKYLRAFVRETKNEFDSTAPARILQTQDARAQRAVKMGGVESRLVRRRCLERMEQRPRKWARFLNFLLDQIEQLNERMVELGMEDDVIDPNPFRERAIRAIERRPGMEDWDALPLAQKAASSSGRGSESAGQNDAKAAVGDGRSDDEDGASRKSGELRDSGHPEDGASPRDLALAEVAVADPQTFGDGHIS